MTTPTLTGTTTIPLGKVLNEDVQIVRKVPNFNIPGTTTGGTLTIGFLGAIRIITINGIWTGTESTLDGYNDTVEAWLNTSNQTKRTYRDSLGNSYQVRCIDWNRNRNPDGPGRVLYTMTLMETF